VDLWKLYLTYIRRINSENAGVSAQESRQTITDAFDFALEHVGEDIDSSSIWQEYIAFIKTWPVSLDCDGCAIN
jgi:cleavage stimulation factor subunit 3